MESEGQDAGGRAFREEACHHFERDRCGSSPSSTRTDRSLGLRSSRRGRLRLARRTPMFYLNLIPHLFLLANMLAVSSSPAKVADPDWPRQIDTPEATIVLYQPQPET